MKASLNSLLLNLKRARQAVEKGVKSLGEGDVEQDGEDKEGSHQDSRASSLGDNEHADKADLGKVNTDEELLEGARVDEASSIDLGLGNKQNVVAVGKVEQAHTDGRPEEHDGCNNSVDDANDCDVGVDGHETSPSESTESSPFVVHGSWSAGQELVQKVENDASDNLSQDADGDGQTLNNEVRNVEVGGGRDGR